MTPQKQLVWDLATGGKSDEASVLIPSRRLDSRAQIAAKRCLDIGFACVVTLILSPVLLLIAALIRCTSPGPVIFRQTRVGKDGKVFTLYKFRTMKTNSDPGLHRSHYRDYVSGTAEANGRSFKLSNDPRITAVGRLLRSTSFDELPQLWNVITGPLSLVGPRPPLPYEVEMYDERAMLRLSAKPGLTGLWQVSGRACLSFQQMVDLDLRYISIWTLWLDLRILLRTPWAVLSGRGAS